MKPALRIALSYALLSGLYIVLSDWLAWQVARRDSEILTQWQSIKGLAFVVASGAIIFLLVLHYVRSRDRIQWQLEEARRSFEMLFQRNPIPVVVYDTAELGILAVNQAAVDEYGYTEEEFLRLKLPTLCPAEDLERVLSHVARIKPHPYAGHWRQIRKDGSEFYVEIASHPILFSGCEARLVAAVNISTRKLAEQSLAEAFTVRAEAEAAKTKFLSTISHEMRTPLNAVTGFLDLLAGESDTLRRREYAVIAQRSAGQLLAMIEQMIAAAALTSQPSDRVLTEVEVDPFLRRITDGYFKAAMRKNIKLNLSADALPRKAVVDAVRLEETLQILLGNAIKFSNGGTVNVSASLEAEAAGAVLRVSVADEGIGIPAAEQSKVFDSFFQVDQNLTRRYGGAGIGLFVARQLCELMGAALEVKSVDGAGSTFMVSLPGKIADSGNFEALR